MHKLVKGEEQRRAFAVVSLLFKGVDKDTPFWDDWNPEASDEEMELKISQLIPAKDYPALYYEA